MISGDMKHKCEKARAKVRAAIELHGGTTLLTAGFTGDDSRIANAVVQAGVRMLEPNHSCVAMSCGYKGVTTPHAAEQVRHEIPMEWVVRTVQGVRNVVGPDIFLTVGVPGGFTETVPMPITEEGAMAVSRAGADGLHVHKYTLADLKDVVELAHSCGLTVDAYIIHPDDQYPIGIPAETPADVAEAGRQMEQIGVDFIGLMTGMTYKGVAAGQIAPTVRERLEALVGAVSVPTLAEGGINPENFHAFRGTGVSILVVGTAVDDLVLRAAQEAVSIFLP